MALRGFAKRLVVGTQWESPVKRLHYALTRSKNSLYDVQTIEIMRRVLRRDSGAVDVGAFEGGMLRHILRFAPQGRHIAFEPIPEKYAALTRRFPQVRIHPHAVGASPGEQTYHQVLEYPALSGLRRRIDLDPSLHVRERTVTVETLDRVIAPLESIALVKVDVEGGELGVFRGGLETLRRCRPVVVFECGLGGADSYGTKPAELHSCLTSDAKLRIFTLDSWLAGGAALSQQEFADQFDRGLNFYFVAAP
ncbi:MAG TPA: FkbM family methyltransferase [Candidatus Eisenbacteria bacterium]|nr:FkbM family methyltransferase [Candidatus Eisenbacteria bacterium]